LILLLYSGFKKKNRGIQNIVQAIFVAELDSYFRQEEVSANGNYGKNRKILILPMPG